MSRPGRKPAHGGARASDRAASPASARERAPSVAWPAAGEADATRAARALWITLALLALARCALAFVPSMALWGLNLYRFLAPPAAWGPWALAALALIPAASAFATPACTRAGDALVRSRASLALAAVLAAMLVGALPDRVRFVGDFLLRQGTVEQVGQAAVLFPQALPLDVLLHVQLPRVLTAAHLLDANGAARLLGLGEAALLALAAVAFARATALGGAAAFAVACIAFFGGTLGMFTGFGKAFSEMVVLVAIMGVAGLRVIREGRGLLALGVAIALGSTLHRSALALLPAGALAYGWWWRDRGARGAWKRPAEVAAHVIPVVTLIVMVPVIVAIMRRWDAIHIVPEEVRAQGGVLRAAFAGPRTLDLANLIVLLAPLAPAVPVVALALRRVPGRGREALFLAALAAPFMITMPFIHPAQGLFRDWDDFAAGGEALTLLAAWLVGETLRGAPRFAWLGLAAALAAAAPSMQWLAHNADLDRGLARVTAFMREPPARSAGERGKTWDYLGIRNFRLARWDAAAAALARAAETSPSPRILLEWATAETRRGDLAAAERVLDQAVLRSPEDGMAWTALTTVAVRRGDRDGARRAAEGLLRARPGDAYALKILAEIGARPAP